MISVVVPVYNVEKYLAKCLESIIAQTYRDIEIVLIDDGSTDESGKICDEYAQRDKRIRVIHQENKGLAEVRNIGIHEARGEYIQFIDSDDWVELDMLETCLDYAEQYNADIVCFRVICEYQGNVQIHSGVSYPPRVMDSAEALSVLFFPQYVDVITCNKLIKSDIFHGIEYPAGKLYEDMYTTYKILGKARKILCISDEFYHYLKRQGSIGSYIFSSTTYDLAEAASKCFEFSINRNNGNSTAGINLQCGLWFWKIVTANYMVKANKLDKEYISSLQKDIKARTVMKCSLLNFTRKTQLLLFKYSLTLYRWLYMRLKRS